MSQWAFLFRQDRCIGCGACVMACKAWNHMRRGDADLYPLDRVGKQNPAQADPDDARGTMRESWRRVTTREEGSCPTEMKITHLSFSCMHCSRPECAAACPKGRIVKEEEFGAVVVDQSKECVSCGLCRKVCPWGAPQLLKAESRCAAMTKCDFCYDRIRSGLKPACVASCPMRALIAGPEAEVLGEFPQAVQDVEQLRKGENLQPHFWIIPRNESLTEKRGGDIWKKKCIKPM